MNTMNINSFKINSFKETSPFQTISKIREILKKIGILLIEKKWFNSFDKFYSVRLEIDKTSYGVNGKGVSYELALASAYAEFMERLQNGYLPFQIYGIFDDEVGQYQKYSITPDEKKYSFESMWYQLPSELKKIYKPSGRQNINDIKRFFEEYSDDVSNETKDELTCIPYFNFKENSITFIPDFIIKYFYASNGMCAGNTKEEAIVQGISEIFERYVNFNILFNGVTPPTISDRYLQKFKKQYDMIKIIEKNSNLKIIIKDGSLGKNLPVALAIFIDESTNSYYVKFGSHPILEIAIERCLTEFMQGRKLTRNILFSEYRYYFKKEIDDLNSNKKRFNTIFQNGEGAYSNNLFSEKYTYSFNSNYVNHSQIYKNNKEMLDAYKQILSNLKMNIICREVSYLGFPSYHIIIPGMSEVFSWENENINDSKFRDKAKKIIINKTYANSSEKLNIVIKYLEAFYGNRKTLSDLDIIGLPLKKHPLGKITLDLFLFLAHYTEKNYKVAYKYILNYIRYLEKQFTKHNEVIRYFMCIRDFIAMKIENKNIVEITNMLSIVYGDPLTKKITDNILNTNSIFENLPALTCWNCNSCNYIDHCSYNSIKVITKSLKEKYKNNFINQLDSVSLFQ